MHFNKLDNALILVVRCDWIRDFDLPNSLNTSFFLPDQNRPLYGKLIGEVRGRLGGKDLSGIKVVGNWSAISPKATSFHIEFHNVPPEHSLCLQVLSEVASPVFWFGAREVN